MADLSFKISDLETIPSRVEEISGNEKIALESTYFLTYSHTIHGMNYVTKNYKVPLSLLRDDITAHVEKIFGVEGLTINGIDNVKAFNIKSKDLTIDNVIGKDSLDINIDMPENFIQGTGDITVSKIDSTWNIHSQSTSYYEALLDKNVYNKNEQLHLDKLNERSLYIIAKDDAGYIQNSKIGINFLGYLLDDKKDDAICSFKLYLNTMDCSSDVKIGGIDIKWVMNSDSEISEYMQVFKPNKIYSITFTSIPIRVFKNTSTEKDDKEIFNNGRVIVGEINWFISYN